MTSRHHQGTWGETLPVTSAEVAKWHFRFRKRPVAVRLPRKLRVPSEHRQAGVFAEPQGRVFVKVPPGCFLKAVQDGIYRGAFDRIATCPTT